MDMNPNLNADKAMHPTRDASTRKDMPTMPSESKQFDKPYNVSTRQWEDDKLKSNSMAGVDRVEIRSGLGKDDHAGLNKEERMHAGAPIDKTFERELPSKGGKPGALDRVGM
jgi:hypothetical protein